MDQIWAIYGRILGVANAVDTVEEEAIQAFLQEELPSIARDLKVALMQVEQSRQKAAATEQVQG